MATGSRDKRDIECNIIEKLQYRFSPFRFQNKAIKPDHLSLIFEAARWTPSAKNIQPWHFLHAAKNSQAYDLLFKCLSDKNQRWAKNAPSYMLCSFNTKDQDGDENFYALHDLGGAVANMTLQAQELGIAFHLMSGEEIKKSADMFTLPTDYKVAHIIAFGYYCLDNSEISGQYAKEFKNSHTRQPQKSFVTGFDTSNLAS